MRGRKNLKNSIKKKPVPESDRNRLLRPGEYRQRNLRLYSHFQFEYRGCEITEPGGQKLELRP
jgi:hypothetical protein